MKTFIQFLLENTAVASASQNPDSNPHIKVDVVEPLRSHHASGAKEVLYSPLKDTKEVEFFKYYLTKVQNRFDISATKDSKLFNNTVTFFFHGAKMQRGQYVRVYAVFPDAATAREIHDELLGQYPKKV